MNNFQNNFAVLQLIISIFFGLATLFVTIYIPRKIMINQLFANLIADYRKSEMGEAILAIFHFYVTMCDQDIYVINEKYREMYNYQIGKYILNNNYQDFSHTLHFQRRLVAQFYYSMAMVYFAKFPGLSKKYKNIWFTMSEQKLIGIILHMAKPARNVFEEAGYISKPVKDESKMNRLIYKLYMDL